MPLPILTRRSFLGGLIAVVAAPAIMRVAPIMPIKAIDPGYVWLPRDVLMKALGDVNLAEHLRYGDMWMLSKLDADRLMVKVLAPEEVYESGLAQWRFPPMVQRMELDGNYVEPPSSWE